MTHGKYVHYARVTGSVQSHILESCEMRRRKISVNLPQVSHHALLLRITTSAKAFK